MLLIWFQYTTVVINAKKGYTAFALVNFFSKILPLLTKEKEACPNVPFGTGGQKENFTTITRVNNQWFFVVVNLKVGSVAVVCVIFDLLMIRNEFPFLYFKSLWL